jgi:hypothetical protein
VAASIIYGVLILFFYSFLASIRCGYLQWLVESGGGRITGKFLVIPIFLGSGADYQSKVGCKDVVKQTSKLLKKYYYRRS